ncbi:hypothetical protein GCM10025734_27470 [Kitasatospora paranensis]
MPRSFWNFRNSKAPFIPAVSRKPSDPAVAAAAVQDLRVRRPRGVPASASTGQTFTSPPKPSSTPPSAGLRAITSRPATAIAVTMMSYRQ